MGVLILAGATLLLFLRAPSKPTYPQVKIDPGFASLENTRPETNIPAPVPSLPSPDMTGEQLERLERMRKVWHVKRAVEYTDDEKAELAKLFTERFKPAIEKWCDAYEGRTPFKAKDITVDNFNSRMGSPGRFQYVFTVDGYTLTLLDQWQDFARVFLMGDPNAAKALNTPPMSGGAPDINVPITRNDIIRMAQADTGSTYQPNQITVTPSGPVTGVNGGAFVGVDKEIAPGGGELITGKSISLVFDRDGKLVFYTGPFNLPASQKK